jgi:hypothetical protein
VIGKNIVEMKNTFLDYYKMILDKVSFDPNLFTKEYRKAIVNLQTNEINDLNHWLQSRGHPLMGSENNNHAYQKANLRK